MTDNQSLIEKLEAGYKHSGSEFDQGWNLAMTACIAIIRQHADTPYDRATITAEDVAAITKRHIESQYECESAMKEDMEAFNASEISANSGLDKPRIAIRDILIQEGLESGQSWAIAKEAIAAYLRTTGPVITRTTPADFQTAEHLAGYLDDDDDLAKCKPIGWVNHPHDDGTPGKRIIGYVFQDHWPSVKQIKELWDKRPTEPVSVSLEKCALALENDARYTPIDMDMFRECNKYQDRLGNTQAVLDAAKAQGARFDYVE